MLITSEYFGIWVAAYHCLEQKLALVISKNNKQSNPAKCFHFTRVNCMICYPGFVSITYSSISNPTQLLKTPAICKSNNSKTKKIYEFDDLFLKSFVMLLRSTYQSKTFEWKLGLQQVRKIKFKQYNCSDCT